MKNAIFFSFIAGLSTLIGSLVIFLNVKEKNINKFIVFFLSFSISVMILLSITELIPKSFVNIIGKSNLFVGIAVIIFIILICLFIIYLFNKLFNNADSLLKLGLLNMLVLMIHNLPEGIITYLSFIKDSSLGLKLTLSIIMHNIPEGAAIAVPIYFATKSKKRALIYALIAGLAEPLGALLTHIFFYKYLTTSTFDYILLFTGFIMIIISINETLPKTKSYYEEKFLKLGLILGLCTIILLNTFL